MFSEIENFMNKEFFNNHQTFKIYTKSDIYDAKIFSIYSIEVNEESKNIKNLSFNECIEYYKTQSKIKVENQDIPQNIIKISTCSYLNNKEQRDTREAVETGGSVVTKDGTSEYYRIVNALGEHASVYEGMGDDSIKRLYYPTVVFVHEGEIVGVQVSLASEEGVDPRKDLTTEQWNDLKTIYKEYMQKVKGACDSSC